jgi:hypothetical protein
MRPNAVLELAGVKAPMKISDERRFVDKAAIALVMKRAAPDSRASLLFDVENRARKDGRDDIVQAIVAWRLGEQIDEEAASAYPKAHQAKDRSWLMTQIRRLLRRKPQD